MGCHGGRPRACRSARRTRSCSCSLRSENTELVSEPNLGRRGRSDQKAFTCILICLDYTHSLASRAGDGGGAQFPRLYCRCRPDAHDMSELSDVEERLLLCVECAGGAKIGEPYSG